MANKSKEEAVQALAEAIDEIGDPLRFISGYTLIIIYNNDLIHITRL